MCIYTYANGDKIFRPLGPWIGSPQEGCKEGERRREKKEERKERRLCIYCMVYKVCNTTEHLLRALAKHDSALCHILSHSAKRIDEILILISIDPQI